MSHSDFWLASWIDHLYLMEGFWQQLFLLGLFKWCYDFLTYRKLHAMPVYHALLVPIYDVIYMLCTMLYLCTISYTMYNVRCYVQCLYVMHNVMFLLLTSLCDGNLQCYLQCLKWVFLWHIGRYWWSSSTWRRWRWWREKVMVTMETDKTNNIAAFSTQPTYCYSYNHQIDDTNADVL